MLPTLTAYSVLLPLPMPRCFDYTHDAELVAGQFVTVPFGKQVLTGLVIGNGDGNRATLKPIVATVNLPPLSPAFLGFLQWAARYTMNSTGLFLKMCLAGSQITAPPPEAVGWQRTIMPVPKLRPDSKPARLLALFTSPETIIDAAQLKQAGFTSALANEWVKRGLLARVNYAAPAPAALSYFASPLTAEQQAAAALLLAGFAAPRPFLLQGVTGSGKTETYAAAIHEALRHGKQAMVLMPEIALTTAMIGRFTSLFGFAPTLWHSGISPKQRRENWWAIARGEARIILGARSALFLPYAQLGLIVVDEEHETAYKQEDGTLYHARDMAVARAHHEAIPVILASATPSLETLVNVKQGRYGVARLPERFGGAQLPTIQRVDMRAEKLPANRFLSAPLLTALREAMAAQEQAMLFLNRRGYAPLTLCRHCGHRLQCPQCSAWLVLHKQPPRLQCHHCGYNTHIPNHCPACQAPDQFAACGPGVERIAEEVQQLLPKARLGLMTSDLLATPAAMTALLAQIHAHEVDILIGTQIMAKGHHFPNITMVGIVDADLGLSGGDPRASERSFQLLQQVAGRGGRGTKAGRAFLQSYQPEHPVIQAMVAQDQAAFVAAELTEREAYDLPPYKRLAALILSGSDQILVQRVAAQLVQALPTNHDLRVLGPAPAMLALLRGQHRWRILLVATRSYPLQHGIQLAVAAHTIPRNIKLQIDIDPYSFY